MYVLQVTIIFYYNSAAREPYKIQEMLNLVAKQIPTNLNTYIVKFDFTHDCSFVMYRRTLEYRDAIHIYSF